FSNEFIFKNILLDNYESVIEEFSCSICSEFAFKKEMYQCKEGHTACKNCFIENIEKRGTCMECRTPLTSINDLIRNRFFENTLSNKIIMCPFSYSPQFYFQKGYEI
ncbi:hypothetical protein DICPUDRAFT_25087, partial [Dictyostelium purpureum]